MAKGKNSNIQDIEKFIAETIKEMKQEIESASARIELPLEFEGDLQIDLGGLEKNLGNTMMLMAANIQQKWIQAISEQLKPQLDAALRASWGWTDGSRDIFDTGELANSLSITVSDGSVSVSYSAPYAGIVHYGGYIQPYGNAFAESVYIPARPWVQAVFGEAPGPVTPINIELALRNAIASM